MMSSTGKFEPIEASEIFYIRNNSEQSHGQPMNQNIPHWFPMANSSNPAPDQYFSNQGLLDDQVIDGLLGLDSIGLDYVIPTPSPVTMDPPNCSAELSLAADENMNGSSSKVSPLELPKAQLEYKHVPSSQSDLFQSSPINQTEHIKEEVIHDTSKVTPSSELKAETISDILKKPEVLGSKNADEIRQLFQASKETIANKINDFWKGFHPLLKRKVGTAQNLVNQRGVKMKRRKRMGADIPASEKKEIRAQRNRERSQALRRHHKQRLLDLEEISEELMTYNNATKALINCLLADETTLPALNLYFAENSCTELLLAFLSAGQ